MKQLIFCVLFLVVYSFGYSKYFSTDFIKEIEFYNNTYSNMKYKKIELEPSWVKYFLGQKDSFKIMVRF